MRKGTCPQIALLVVLCSLGIVATAYAHCQIPCGIYDDPARITAMTEHIKTIEKSMQQIKTLSGHSPQDNNQIVRWVMNKEKHADELAEIITYYFMAQRIKPAADVESEAYTKYVHELTLLHQMLQASMKSKQSVELAHVQELRSLLQKFGESYLGPQAGPM